MLDTLPRAVLMFFLVTSMAGIGLQVNLRDLVAMLRRRGLLLRSLLINFLVIPALGWLATRLVAMEPTSADAMLILACAPGGITAIQFTSKSKDVLAFAGQTAFLLTGISIFVSPFLMSIFLPAELPLIVPYARAFWYVFLFLLLPMGLGVFLRERAERLAERLGKPLAYIGSVAFILFVVLTLSTRRAAMAGMGNAEVGAMLGFIVATMIVGWVGGGPQWETRRVLASASSMRNVALSLAIVTRSFPGAGVEVPLVAFCALMITPNMIFLLLMLVLRRLWRKA
ncbi:MAG TPA: bile acid:sodium symporter [Terracidiphilus sp.]